MGKKKAKPRKPRVPMSEQDPAERIKNFDEVPHGYSPEQAEAEAERQKREDAIRLAQERAEREAAERERLEAEIARTREKALEAELTAERAMELLKEAIVLNPTNRIQAFHDPDFESMRETSEFRELFESA